MKHLLVCAGLLFAATTVIGQQKPVASPPAKATGTIGGHEVTITYSSPAVKGREGKIFTKDGLISHNPTYPVWRAGANTASILHTDGDLMIGDVAVPKGDYSLYVNISNPDAWVLVVNKLTVQWCTKYDKAQDLGRVKMHMAKPPAMVENLQYSIAEHGGKGT
jgi:hypothetical protein